LKFTFELETDNNRVFRHGNTSQ